MHAPEALHVPARVQLLLNTLLTAVHPMPTCPLCGGALEFLASPVDSLSLICRRETGTSPHSGTPRMTRRKWRLVLGTRAHQLAKTSTSTDMRAIELVLTPGIHYSFDPTLDRWASPTTTGALAVLDANEPRDSATCD